MMYGTDISAVMVNTSAAQCPSCKLLQWDLNLLQGEAYNNRIVASWPTSFDIVLVSDVLYYLSWAGWPPILSWSGLLPDRFTKEHKRRWWKRLTALARKEVIFSDHQMNPAVVAFLQEMGATRHVFYGIWTARGTANSSS